MSRPRRSTGRANSLGAGTRDPDLEAIRCSVARGTLIAKIARMFVFQLAVCLLIAVASGAIMRAIAGRSPFWVLASATLGFVGALLGAATGRLTLLSDLLAIDVAGDEFQILWSIAGAIFLVIWCIAAQVLASSALATRPWTMAPVRPTHGA